MHPEADNNREYTVSVSTGDIYEAIASVASALYTLVEEALALHEDHEAEECEFELFARDILGVLTRHGDQLSGYGTIREADGDHEYD